MTESGRRLNFEAYGVGVMVEVRHDCAPSTCSFPGVESSVDAYLPPGSTLVHDGDLHETSPRGTVTMRCSGTSLAVTGRDETVTEFSHAADALHGLDQAIRSIVAVNAPGLLFFHAGMVAIGDRALVLPGRSMTGKTTLVAALIRAGARYGSDEYAVVDADGLVHPYPRRLSIREPAGRREVPVEDLGSTAVENPIPVGLIASLRFEPGASLRVGAGSQADCARSLLDNAVAAQPRSAEALAGSARLARGSRFVEGVRGDADAAAIELIEMLGS